jgi:hypothetical protein
MGSRSEGLPDVAGDAVSGAGDVDPTAGPHRSIGLVEGGDEDTVHVVGPLGAADLASVDAVVDGRSEVDERQSVDDRVFLLAVEVGADHPVEVVGIGGCEAFGVALTRGEATLVAAAGASGEYLAQTAASFETARQARLAQQGGEVSQQIVAGLGGHTSVRCAQSAGQRYEQNDVRFHVRPSADGHVEQGEHDLVRTVLVGEVPQCADERAEVVDSVERLVFGGPVAWERLVGKGLLECSELCTEIHSCLLGVGLSEAMVRFGVPGDVPGQVPDQGFLFPTGAL